MNRQPPQPLDAEERALAALLSRMQGRGEPGAELDARILASARAALHAPSAPRRPRRSWIAPMAVAASLMLAVGLAWQLRPPAAPTVAAPAAEAASADSATMAIRSIEAPLPQATIDAPAKPPPMVAVPPPVESMPPTRIAKAPAEPVAPAPVAVAPPPAPPAPVGMDDVAAAPTAAPQATMESARPSPPAMAKAARTGEFARERASAAGNAAAQAQDESRDEAQKAADAAANDQMFVDDPGEDVPPATADAPEVRDAWLKRIGELLQQGKRDEARASLAEFKRRYPDATLPPELRKLEH